MSNLTLRILSTMVIAVGAYSAMVLDVRSRWAILALFLSLGAWEWTNMLRTKYGGPKVAWLSGIAVILACMMYMPGFALPYRGWIWGVACGSVLLYTLLGFRYLDISAMAPWIYLNLFGIAFHGLYASALFNLTWPYAGWKGIYPFLMVQFLIAAADTGAYFTGRKFGRVKLAPSISSGKTREGAIGGAVFTTLLAVVLGPVLVDTGWLASLGLGLLMALCGVCGDLFISILKRHVGAKDSSRLIPGHGGVLDRFDAFFFSAPVAVFYLRLVG